MTLIALEDAGPRLSQLIEDARDGEEIILTRDSAPVAKLVPLGQAAPRPRFGSAKDVILYIADDFDAPLEDFKDYM
jgi:prevent-host-death family protein